MFNRVPAGVNGLHQLMVFLQDILSCFAGWGSSPSINFAENNVAILLPDKDLPLPEVPALKYSFSPAI